MGLLFKAPRAESASFVHALESTREPISFQFKPRANRIKANQSKQDTWRPFIPRRHGEAGPLIPHEGHECHEDSGPGGDDTTSLDGVHAAGIIVVISRLGGVGLVLGLLGRQAPSALERRQGVAIDVRDRVLPLFVVVIAVRVYLVSNKYECAGIPGIIFLAEPNGIGAGKVDVGEQGYAAGILDDDAFEHAVVMSASVLCLGLVECVDIIITRSYLIT